MTGATNDALRETLRAICNAHLQLLRTPDFEAVWLWMVHPSDRGGRYHYAKRLKLLGLLGWFARTAIEQKAPGSAMWAT